MVPGDRAASPGRRLASSTNHQASAEIAKTEPRSPPECRRDGVRSVLAREDGPGIELVIGLRRPQGVVALCYVEAARARGPAGRRGVVHSVNGEAVAGRI